MSIQYHLYGNDHAGGPIDYGTVLATATGLTWATPALSFPSDNSFGIRAFDSVTGFEEQNVDATVRIILDSAGHDITNRPGAPTALTVALTANAGVTVHWQRPLTANAGIPTGYHVYVGTPTPNYSSAAATVADTNGRDYSANLTGLTGGTTYQVGVRAYNTTAEEPNTTVVTFTADNTPPANVDSFTATPTYSA